MQGREHDLDLILLSWLHYTLLKNSFSSGNKSKALLCCLYCSLDEHLILKNIFFFLYSMQVNSRKQTMDTQLFSPLLGAVPSPPMPPEPSQLCRDWPGCAEDFGSQTAFQECPKQRYQHPCCGLGASGSLGFLYSRINSGFFFFFLGEFQAFQVFFARWGLSLRLWRKDVWGFSFFHPKAKWWWQNIAFFWRELGDRDWHSSFWGENALLMSISNTLLIFLYHLLYKTKSEVGWKWSPLALKVLKR